MKALLIAAIAALAVGASIAAAKNYPSDVTFAPDAVQVGDAYTVSADNLTPGALVSIGALYGSTWPSCFTNADADGEASCEFVALDEGNDSEGGKFCFSQGNCFTTAHGEVLHIVWQEKKQGCGANGCYDLVGADTLTVMIP